MFGRTLTLFEVLGIKVKVDASWLILAVLITWSLAKGFFPARYEGLEEVQYWAMGVIGAAGLFVSIILHELSHSVVALRHNLPIKSITLFIFGGIAEMTKEPPFARAELNIAIAGPLASMALAIFFFVLSGLSETVGLSVSVVGVLNYLVLLNGVLAVFNMLPAFPLDGGRVFRAFLWQRTNDFAAATRSASKLGGFFGMLLIVAGVAFFITGNLIGGLWWGMIGLFLRGAAQAATLEIGVKQVFENKPVAHFMNTNAVSVTADLSVHDLVEHFIYRYHYDLFPVIEGGSLIGSVTTGQVRQVPREQWMTTRVGDIFEPCSETNMISADEDANKALSKMRRSGNGRLLVTEKGRLVGVLVLKDMLELLALRADLEPED